MKVLKDKGATLRILGMGMDTSTATGQLMLNVMGAVAQFEREMMLDRQREGIAKAKADGKYQGRKATAMDQSEKVKALLKVGWTRPKVAEELGMSLRSVYRAQRSEAD